ncbi:MAG: hypothetical protein ACI9Y1_001302 [Lentisphaeria bacterium]|jgi:hypothetical protein
MFALSVVIKLMVGNMQIENIGYERTSSLRGNHVACCQIFCILYVYFFNTKVFHFHLG